MFSFLIFTELSPPMATDLKAKALTCVKNELTLAPLEESRRFPERTNAMSVVVPPISNITDVWLGDASAIKPMMLAAGPEKLSRQVNQLIYQLVTCLHSL